MAIAGSTIVVGASLEGTGVNYSGAAYVFQRNGTAWTEQAMLKPSYPRSNGFFGWSVAISSETLAIGETGESSTAVGINGSPQDDNGASFSGAVHVFVRSASAWSRQAHLKASNAQASDGFGVSVGLSGNMLLVGAYMEKGSSNGAGGDPADNGAKDAGAAYLFVRNGSAWTQQAYLKAGNTGAGDRFGERVAVQGDSMVIGAPREDSSTRGIDTKSNDDADLAGAVYVFR